MWTIKIKSEHCTFEVPCHEITSSQRIRVALMLVEECLTQADQKNTYTVSIIKEK